LVNATVVPLQEAAGGPDAVVGTILLLEDITDRVHLEEQLQISEKMASIGLLAAGVAHEVNTPLTGISSFTQMLLDGADPADPKTVLLEKIEKQTFRAAKIVNGLLNLSRTGSGDTEPVRDRLSRPLTILAARNVCFSIFSRSTVLGSDGSAASRSICVKLEMPVSGVL